MRTPDHVCPPAHSHGSTMTCATSHGCKCDDCKTAHREYSYFHRNMKAAGRDVFNSLVDATGTRRRIQALMCLGWSQSEISRRTGIRQARLSAHLHTPHVTKSSRDRISRVYDTLCLQIPPTETTSQRISVNRTLALARRNKWAAPLAWDDIDNDPAPATVERTDEIDHVAVDRAIAGEKIHLTSAERRAAVTILHNRRYGGPLIAETLHCNEKTVNRIRHELGLPLHDQNDLIDRRAA